MSENFASYPGSRSFKTRFDSFYNKSDFVMVFFSPCKESAKYNTQLDNVRFL